MVVRSVVRDNSTLLVYIDNVPYVILSDSGLAAGQPGLGVGNDPTGNGISSVSVGGLDTIAPAPVSAQAIATAAFPNRIDFQWQGMLDDANGIGIAYYVFARNGAWVSSFTQPEYSDTTVAASTTYNDQIIACDYHFNCGVTAVAMTTPPVNQIDPREVGVRPTGTYWGAAGEQIDVRSGNLNYTFPLLKAMGRGGWGVGINLTYNSQNWRSDPAGVWKLGQDTGYGFGWKMLAGSLTPFYTDYWTVHHYLFTDSTGAEYRLDQNSGGVWSSKESIYVWYDSNTARLNFRDGSFWALGSTSAVTEQDAGTQYPTLMQDSNGNQVTLTYNAGQGLTGMNSSSRIQSIQDVRFVGGAAYTFTYANDVNGNPHLSAISNSIGAARTIALCTYRTRF